MIGEYKLYACPGCGVAFIAMQSICSRGEKAAGWIGPEQAFFWKNCKACDLKLSTDFERRELERAEASAAEGR